MTAAGVSIRPAVDRFLFSPRRSNPNIRRSYATALEKWTELSGRSTRPDSTADAIRC